MTGAVSIGAIPGHISNYFGGEEINIPGAIFFQNSNQNLEITTSTGDHLVSPVATSLCVETWYRSDSTPSGWEVLARAVNEFTFQINGAGANNFISIFKHDGAYVEFGYDGTNLWDGNWHFLTGEYDSTGGFGHITIDGDTVENNRVNVTDSDDITAGTAAFLVGGNESDGEGVEGYISELRISNIIRYGGSSHLVPNGIMDLSADTGNVLGHWLFEDDEGGTIVTDLSTSAADLSFGTNAPTWGGGPL